METVDCVIHPRWLVPVEPAGAVWENHSLAVHHGRIAGILPRGQALEQWQPGESVDLPDHALMPGLVNAHTHAAMSLMRGLADDLPLMEWLKAHIWPAESQFMSPQFVADGVELAMGEMLRGGTTCFQDMYFFPDVVARTTAAAGIRACIGLIMLDFPTPWAAGPGEYLDKGRDIHDSYRDHPLISTAFAPHAPYTVSDKPLERMRIMADELNLGVHMHVHETADEISRAVHDTGQRPLARLDELGLLTPGFMAVHMTQLDDREIELCCRTGLSVIHCPESNLKLASGFCPAARLDAAGVNLALGTDSAASNNDLDMFGEMRTAALLAKAVAGDASAMPSARALRMATLGGARALGLEQELGSLEAGKWADLCAVNLNRPETQPLFDVISQLVYAGGREQVSDVWVAGRRLLHGGALTTLDPARITASARQWRARMAPVSD